MKPSRVPAFFAGLAFVFGTALVLLTPPFQVADEFWHFFRAYQVSLGQFIAQSHDHAQGGVLPVSLLRLSGRFAELPYHPDRKTSWRIIAAAGRIPLDPRQTTFCYFPISANYSPLVYAPQAIAIAAGRWVNLPPLDLLYLGREASLIAWTILGYLTLRLAATPRRGILIVLLMPMSLASAASVSADSMTNAICILFTALVWHQSIQGSQKCMNASTKLAIFALSIGVTLCKFAYLPLVLLVLLIPSSRLGGRRGYARFAVTLLLVNVLVSIAWLSTTAGAHLSLRPDRPDVSVARQLAFLHHHPLAFFPAMVKGLATAKPSIVHSFIGYLGWDDNPTSPAVAAVYWLAIVLFCWPAENDPPRPPIWRLAVVAASICGSTLIFSLFDYLAWTSVGAARLDGVQGRYFIPLAAALLILIWAVMRWAAKLIPPLPSRPSAGAKLNFIAMAFCICGCFYALFLVYRRYFALG